MKAERSFPKKRYTINPRHLKFAQVLAVAAAALVFLAARDSDFFYVSRVIDGDTIKLSNGEKVRLIGIDTPETYFSDKLLRDSRRSRKDVKTIQGMGGRSTEFVKTLVGGKRVRLEYDVQKRDRYKRLLAYVYLEDGTFVNGRIVEEGYAQVMTIPPNVKYADHLARLQKAARENKKGLWANGGTLP